MRFFTILFLCFLATACQQTAKDEKEEKPAAPVVATNPLEKIINDYLSLKDAFFSNDSTKISQAASTLTQSLKTDSSKLDAYIVPNKASFVVTTTQLSTQLDSLTKGKTTMEKLMVFKNMTNPVKAIALLTKNQNLYIQNCPMATDYSADENVFWLSNTQKIQNPFYPRKMPTCGNVVDTIVEIKK